LRENTIQYIKVDLTSFREVKPKKQETDKKELRASKEGPNDEPNKENQSTSSAQRKQANENEQEELFQDEEADATNHCGITILHSGFVTDRKSRVLLISLNLRDLNCILPTLVSVSSREGAFQGGSEDGSSWATLQQENSYWYARPSDLSMIPNKSLQSNTQYICIPY